MKDRYGDNVQVEYHDLVNDEERDSFPELVRIVEEKKASLPAVTIDGELKLIGRADFWPIANLIDERLKGAAV